MSRAATEDAQLFMFSCNSNATGAGHRQGDAALLSAEAQNLFGSESLAQPQEEEDGGQRDVDSSAARPGDLPSHQSHRVGRRPPIEND